jgi:hypothetical protein
MHPFLTRAAVLALAGSALAAAPAGAQSVKVSGQHTDVQLLGSVKKTLASQKVTVSPIASARRSGGAVRFPLTNGRWNFAERDGYLNHFRGDTGMRLKVKSSRRSVSLVDPRIVVTDGKTGYITANITNERFKVFRFTLRGAKVTETASAQTISNIKLVVTKAAATRINRSTRRRSLRQFRQVGVLTITVAKPAAATAPAPAPTAPAAPAPAAPAPAAPAPAAPAPAAPAPAPTAPRAPAVFGTSTVPGGQGDFAPALASLLSAGSSITPLAPGIAVDLDGDGRPDAGVVSLPLKSGTLDATTRTGTVTLDGGLIISSPGVADVRLEDPELVLGADQGLFAIVNGVRVKVGDVNADAAQFTVADGLVTLSELDVRVSTEGSTVLGGLLGTPILPGGQLARLQVVAPQA